MVRVHDDELDIDDELVRALLREQLPHWAELPIRRVEPEGTVNVIYRLGSDMSVRLPRVDWAADEEHQRDHVILGLVRPWISLEVPNCLHRGEPGAGYPWTWSVYSWIGGELPTEPVPVEDLAAFIASLQRADPKDAPVPAGGRDQPLSFRDRYVRDALEVVDAPGARELWEQAMRAPEWDRPPVWIHADLDRRNVLVRDGRLVAVLDWGGAGRGDPAVDVQSAWKLIANEDHDRFRELLDVDDDTWLRAQGWVLSQALLALAYYTPENNPAIHAEATRWLAAVLPG